MAKKKIVIPKKTIRSITVREHVLKVPVSSKNPEGKTIRDSHTRRQPGTDLDREGIFNLYRSYDLKGLIYPTAKRLLKEYKNSDDYDELIAVWIDFFNKKLGADVPLDPDLVKALIASESSFRHDPSSNRIAFGITQITKQTLRVIQDPRGEAKEFIFKGIRQKDLKEPNVAIALAVRWLYRKQYTAKSKLGRMPSHEEVILDYKGLLRSTTKYKDTALENYRRHYGIFKK